MSTLILCFHRIANPDHGGRSLLAISPEDFEKTLTEIGRSREFVTLEESSRPSSAQRAVVTFDDGYLDNLTAALPILESRGIPATFFLSTGFIDSDLLFPPDALDAVMEVPRVDISAGLEKLIANGYWKALDTLASLP
ncbi:MAG: polysaccharide deacetylase family protein, partial [Microbacteriaceae bacterium]|nr:polysaccharide deacetylase family protein [Microbacteriaceae bacterium]